MAHDGDTDRSIIVPVITQSPAGFQGCLNEGNRTPSPLSHHLSDGSARTLSLRNECMSLPVWGNNIATCFGFSWPGLTLASAVQRLFISSCAVAIYPAATADNSTISHQLQWKGGFGSTYYTQATA